MTTVAEPSGPAASLVGVDGRAISDTHPALALPREQLSGRIQHTLVGQAVTERDVRAHVNELLEHGFDAAIVPPCWVGSARSELNGTIARIGSIVDYPYGMAHTQTRVAQAAALVEAGVDELDATVNIGYLLSGRRREFAADLAAVVAAASPVGVKFMLELPLLDEQQRVAACAAAVDAGAAFVSIASHASVGIADPAGIRYLRNAVPRSVGVKASGGIITVEQVRALMAAGADLIGTSAGVCIVTGVGTAKGSLYSY